MVENLGVSSVFIGFMPGNLTSQNKRQRPHHFHPLRCGADSPHGPATRGAVRCWCLWTRYTGGRRRCCLEIAGWVLRISLLVNDRELSWGGYQNLFLKKNLYSSLGTSLEGRNLRWNNNESHEDCNSFKLNKQVLEAKDLWTMETWLIDIAVGCGRSVYARLIREQVAPTCGISNIWCLTV